MCPCIWGNQVVNNSNVVLSMCIYCAVPHFFDASVQNWFGISPEPEIDKAQKIKLPDSYTRLKA